MKKSSFGQRFWAFAIDLAASCLFVLAGEIFLYIPFLRYYSLLLFVIWGVTALVFFFLRDYLLAGRSIGKRLQKLMIVDKTTGAAASGKQLVIKDLFTAVSLYDGLCLLFSGRSIGERASSTVVIYDPELAVNFRQLFSERESKVAQKRRQVALVMVICISVVMLLVTSFALKNAMKGEGYKLAYDYLRQSEVCEQINEDEILLTGYSETNGQDHANGETVRVVTYSFWVRGEQYQVVCHRADDTWSVCGICTDFH